MNQYQSENITELAKDLLNVQRTVQPVTKDAENPFTKSWYASLNSVMDACRDALIENGIWLSTPEMNLFQNTTITPSVCITKRVLPQ